MTASDKTSQSDAPRWSNPFSAERLKPGAIDYLFPPDATSSTSLRSRGGGSSRTRQVRIRIALPDWIDAEAFDQ